MGGDMKVVIVGNGIVGLSTALGATISESSNEIYVVGPNNREGGATPAAAAMLASFAEIEDGTLHTKVDEARFELSRLATKRWPSFVQNICEDITPDRYRKNGFFCLGTYVINNSFADELDDRNFTAIKEALVRFQADFDFVDPKEIPNYKPLPHLRALEAIKIHEEGWLNPNAVICHLERPLLKKGVCFLD